MNKKLIIDGNAVYELDEECMLKKRLAQKEEKKTYTEELKKTEYKSRQNRI